MDWKFEFGCTKALLISRDWIGASNAVAAHAAMHVPRPALQATIIGGAAGAATVPKGRLKNSPVDIWRMQGACHCDGQRAESEDERQLKFMVVVSSNYDQLRRFRKFGMCNEVVIVKGCECASIAARPITRVLTQQVTSLPSHERADKRLCTSEAGCRIRYLCKTLEYCGRHDASLPQGQPQENAGVAKKLIRLAESQADPTYKPTRSLRLEHTRYTPPGGDEYYLSVVYPYEHNVPEKDTHPSPRRV
ncbi:hypothetical protein BKA83DRAFT_4120698 [Pisolithus microcarpus]|nr:hypothetical protein BKA83DRAFT_4120698 [Pisolithus microcarpus]